MASDIKAQAMAELDLSGFRRRLPHAITAWQLAVLDPDQLLRLVLAPSVEPDRWLGFVRSCGGEAVADERVGERTVVTVRRARPGTATHRLDVRGARCPVPVVEARRRIRAMASGEMLQVVTDCTGAPTEMSAWAASSAGVALLAAWQQGGRDHVFLLGRR